MVQKKKQRPLHHRVAIDIAGGLMIIAAPLLGWLPGPGGIPLFIGGVGLLSLNHEWAEKLLKDLERHRENLVSSVMMASPAISRSFDALSIIGFAGGLYIEVTQHNLIIRGVGLGLISVSIIVLLSNQKRFEKLRKRFIKR